MTDMLDIDRILQTRIPDITPVYGGVRGRTMSSGHQAYAWPAIVEAGVRTVIDLRDKDASDRLPEICSEYGLEYFHYPVNNDLSSIEEMVRLLPQFCKRIDRGNFYIACAMGLHRTDIALCLYWVFHAADRGVEVPEIRGYRAEDGHKVDTIMKVLNAVFKYMTANNRTEPMPVETFKERKKMIESQATVQKGLLLNDSVENDFSYSRNGHELKDMYDPVTNTLDIRSNGIYPSNVLSNLCSNAFVFDGVHCSSMEGFLQSLKHKDIDKQRQLCSMKGGNARKHSITPWQTDQIVYWKNRSINRQSREFSTLVGKAYRAMFEQNERFRTALMQTRGINLSHSSGTEDKFKTILTPTEFIGILEHLRDEHDNAIIEKKRVYFDMDGVLMDFESGLAKVSDEIKEQYAGRLDEIPGLFSLMEPMPGAVDAVNALSEKYDLYILSTAPWCNPSAWSDKLVSVQKYFGDAFYKRITITHHKELLKGDYLIDDRAKNGADGFEGELIQFGSECFPDWSSIVIYLMETDRFTLEKSSM